MGMTTKTDEQERVDFEAWVTSENEDEYGPQVELLLQKNASGDYSTVRIQAAWEAYQAGRAALPSQYQEDAERYRYLITKLQQSYDGDYIEIDPMSLYCHMQSQFKGDRVIRAEITWGSETGEPIGLSEAIDHARRIEGES